MAEGNRGEADLFRLTERTTLIGSAPQNDIVLDEPSVSRRHAIIRRDYRGAWIADLGTRDGTWVNDERLGDEPRRLRDGDRVEIGRRFMHMQWVFVEALGDDEAPQLVRSDRGPTDGGPTPVEAERTVSPGPSAYPARRTLRRPPGPGPGRESKRRGRIIPLPRNVLMAMLGALLGGEAVIIGLLIYLVLRV